jgi:hypothetical protein
MPSLKGTTNPSFKHGQYVNGKPTTIYLRWQNMKARCLQPSHKDYAKYGAKGVTICDRWAYGADGLSGFEWFILDMGPLPFAGASIDRIDGTRGYEPNNCRWATLSEQATNKHNTRWLEIDGKSKPLTVWAKEVGIGPKTVHYRLKRGLSAKDAVFLRIDKSTFLNGRTS